MDTTEFTIEDGFSKYIPLLKKWLFWLLAFIGIVALVFVYFGEISEQTNRTNRSDFFKFYLSSSNLLQNKAVYWQAPDRASPTSHCNPDIEKNFNKDALEAMPEAVRLCLHPNLNPPFFVALTTPFALLDYPHALWAWSIASFISGIWALILIFKSDAFPSEDSTVKTFVGLVFFAYYPSLANTEYGQVTLFLLLDITLAWQALRNGKNRTAGCWLGAAASIKPFFGLFLIALLISKNWRAVSSFIATCGFCFLAGGLLVGFSAYLTYIAILNDVTWLASSWNGSYTGFFIRLFGGPVYKAWIDTPAIGRGLFVACSLATISALGYVIIKLKEFDSKLSADSLVAMTIPAMLLISPLGWVYYFPLLFISFTVIWNLTTSHANGRIYRLLLILVTIPTIPPKPLLPVTHSPQFWFWDAGVYFYLLVFTFLLAAIAAHQVSQKNYLNNNM